MGIDTFPGAGIECCRHHDDQEIGTALFLDVERARKRDVAVKMPFVELIEDQRLNSAQCPDPGSTGAGEFLRSRT